MNGSVQENFSQGSFPIRIIHEKPEKQTLNFSTDDSARPNGPRIDAAQIFRCDRLPGARCRAFVLWRMDFVV